MVSKSNSRIDIDWKIPPYSHSWSKNIDSVMNPLGSKITFPQFVVEMLIYNRCKYIKSFPKIVRGEGWSNAISKQIRGLCQQAYLICNFFPHPQEENLVTVAFKNVFRNQMVFKIGQFRKVRIYKDGKLNITQDEKDIIMAVSAEFNNLKSARDSLKAVTQGFKPNFSNFDKNDENLKEKDIKFRKVDDIQVSGGKKSLGDLMKIEKSGAKI